MIARLGAAPTVTGMATTRSSAAALVVLAASIASLAPVGFAVASPTEARSAQDGCFGAYGWPVEPFDRAHPVRGNFGDPRTRYDAPRSDETLAEGTGSLSFHQGLDINAPDGAPVYAVASGRVVRARGRRVTVSCDKAHSFQYWHIYEAVRVGQRVEAGKTVVGFILPKREHVHLTELRGGRAVNPLAPGHLTPYRDSTSPQVLAVSVRADNRSLAELTGALSGSVVLVAEAVDTPAQAVQGRWSGGFPVTPARVAWRIDQDGRTVVPERVAWDVTRTVPRNDCFWEEFARGTYQNWPVFGGDKFRFERGRYLFGLALQPFDTHALADGDYELVVVASDTAGNVGIGALRFVVRNALSGS